MVDVPGLTDEPRKLVQDIKDLFGDVYTDIRSKHRPGQRRPHRLMMLEERVQEMLDCVDQRSEALIYDGLSTTELRYIITVLQEFASTEPRWEKHRRACFDPKNFDHLVLTLELRRVFRNWGEVAELVPETEDTSTPNLHIFREGVPALAVEMKCKEYLKDPDPGAMPYREAQQIIKRSLDSAADQLAGELPGMLAIGGFTVQLEERRLLEEAAKEWFRRYRGKKKNLAGIMFCSFHVYLKNGGSDPTLIPAGSVLMPSLHVNTIKNPSYTGSFPLILAPGRSHVHAPGYRRWSDEKAEFVESTPDGVRLKPVDSAEFRKPVKPGKRRK